MFDFIEKASMLYFVKSLADIQEYSRAVLLVIECFMYGVGNPVALLWMMEWAFLNPNR